MELDPTRRVQTRKRKPFSDCTNTFDSHSSVPFKPNPLSSSPFNKTSAKRIASTNSSPDLNNPSNPSSPILSTPSLKSSSLRGTSDVEASGRISITYSRRRNSNLRKDKGKALVIPVSSDSNQRKDKGKAVANSISSDSYQRKDKGKALAFSIGSDSNQLKDKGKAVANSISSDSYQRKDKGKALAFSIGSDSNQLKDKRKAVANSISSDSYQRKDKGKALAFSIGSDSNQLKDKGKAVAISISSTPNLKISNSWEKRGRVDGVNVPKTKALTVPLRKKHRSVSSEQDVLKDPVLQDFIEKQRAYFKSIDEFKLSEEEVESGDELD